MKTNRSKLQVVITTLFLSFLMACAVVPITGRKQLSLVPEQEMIGMSLTSYKQFLSENRLSNDQSSTEMVKRVGSRIAAAVTKFLKDKGMEGRIKNFHWEFNLVKEDVPNAWCMPGGKVVVYTGLLLLTKDETGLAVVMGHEIAHAIARHGNERMSQNLAVQMGGMALSTAIQDKPEKTQMIFMSAFGLGSQVGVMLPYSRLHESEADKMGLIFMAMAGYNPQMAIPFWERMSQKGGEKPPEILSTHPADETRIAKLKEFMPEALKYYKN